MDQNSLPLINTYLNATALLFMTSGYITIRVYRHVNIHRLFMSLAVLSSAAFLSSYLYYHFFFEAKKYTGNFPVIYYGMLLSHIILAATVPFLVGRVIYFALNNELSRHKRLARVAIVIWAYVSFTGILVYLFVHQGL